MTFILDLATGSRILASEVPPPHHPPPPNEPVTPLLPDHGVPEEPDEAEPIEPTGPVGRWLHQSSQSR